MGIRFFTAFILIFSLYVTDAFAARVLAMRLVGSFDGKVVTDKDIDANYIIDRALFNNGKIDLISVGSEEFNGALNRFLIESMVSQEANNFGIAKVTDSEVSEAMVLVKKKVLTSSSRAKWGALNISDSELREMITKKLRSSRFIKYKSNSSYVQVTDEEAREYFSKNKLRFGSIDYEGIKSNIKKYLGQKNAEERLKDWFSILKKKYKVKNNLAGQLAENAVSSQTPE